MNFKDKILALYDAGYTPPQIIAALPISRDRVYQVLREKRPERLRARKSITSKLPTWIRALYAEGIQPTRIATLLAVSRAYVYRQLELDR